MLNSISHNFNNNVKLNLKEVNAMKVDQPITDFYAILHAP